MQDDWYRILSDAGISIVSSGNCFDRTIPTCTSVDGMTKVTVNTLIALKKESGCTITLTGGTEVGHKNGKALFLLSKPLNEPNGFSFKIMFSLDLVRNNKHKYKYIYQSPILLIKFKND